MSFKGPHLLVRQTFYTHDKWTTAVDSLKPSGSVTCSFFLKRRQVRVTVNMEGDNDGKNSRDDCKTSRGKNKSVRLAAMHLQEYAAEVQICDKSWNFLQQTRTHLQFCCGALGAREKYVLQNLKLVTVTRRHKTMAIMWQWRRGSIDRHMCVRDNVGDGECKAWKVSHSLSTYRSLSIRECARVQSLWKGRTGGPKTIIGSYGVSDSALVWKIKVW